MWPTSRENTPHEWGRAENISTHLSGLSRSGRFLISAADSLSAVAGTPLAPGLLELGAPFQLWRRLQVFYQVQNLPNTQTKKIGAAASSAWFERMIVPLSKVTSISDLDSLFNEAQKESGQDRKPRAVENTIRLLWRVESEEIEKRKWSSLHVKYIRYFLWPRLYGYSRHLF